MTRLLNSLHLRLMVWLLVPLLFLSIAHLVITYLDTKKASEQVFDKLLVTLALSISEHALASGGDTLTDDLLEMIRVTTNDNLYYKVIGPDNSFVVGYEDIPSPPNGINVIDRQLEFYDSHYLDQAVRVSAVSTLIDRDEFKGWMTTFVAQTLNDRNQFVHTSLLDNLWRLTLIILLTMTLFSFGVIFGLRPLRRLQDSVERRDMHDLSPMRQQPLPTEIAGVVEALNDLLGRLSAHISLTKSFVENAAHQLRTPVSALIPQTDLALRRAQSEREKITINKIRDSAKRIGRLTHQLLNLTYAESISLSQNKPSTMDLATSVSRHIDQLNRGGLAVNLSLQLAPAPIVGLPLLIEEVIDNLIDNAIKYSPAGEIVLVRTKVENDTSVLEVRDRGIGIIMADRDKVFDRFFRSDESKEGSGLGLSIVKEIVSLHNGTIKIVDPADGIGTSIICSFPLAAPNKQ